MPRRDRSAPIDWANGPLPRGPRKPRRHRPLKVLVVVLIVLDVAVLWFVASFARIRVVSTIDEPSVRPSDHLLLRKGATVHRGELVEVHLPELHGALAVVRVVGLPGDRLGARNGRLDRNGHPVAEGFLAPGTVTDRMPDVVVPPHDVYLLGDARQRAVDSRYYGPVPEADIRGHLVLRFWPLSRWGRL